MTRPATTPSALPTLPALRGVFSARILPRPAAGPVLDLDAPDGEILASWLAAEAGLVAGADRKLAASYLLGNLAFALSEVLGGLALQGVLPRVSAPGTVAIAARRELWEADGQTGTAMVYDVVLGEARPTAIKDPAVALRAATTRLLRTLVRALEGYARLSTGALWRLVGDSLSAALLMHGKHTSRERDAMEIALAILREGDSPLRAPQTHFVDVSLPERPGIAEWFRIRGGCCRAYTAQDGAYCATCVLRDETSRIAMLRDHLRRMRAAPAP